MALFHNKYNISFYNYSLKYLILICRFFTFFCGHQPKLMGLKIENINIGTKPKI